MWVRVLPATGDVPAPVLLAIVAMTDNNEDSSRPSADTIPPSSSPEHESSSSSSSTPTPMPDRTELLDKARHFLSSPQVVHQDYDSKRRFLTEKGLGDGDIELLLREIVRPVFIPVRTTPQARVPKTSPRSFPSCLRGCIPHHPHPIYQVFSWVLSRCFHG